MKNCPNCGAPIDPYKVKCEYCGTMYFDLATWLQEGKPCFINYSLNSIYGEKILTTLTALAIPHLESVDTNNEPIYATNINGTRLITYGNRRTCEINIKFECVENPNSKTLFQIKTTDVESNPE